MLVSVAVRVPSCAILKCSAVPLLLVLNKISCFLSLSVAFGATQAITEPSSVVPLLLVLVETSNPIKGPLLVVLLSVFFILPMDRDWETRNFI